MLARQQSSEPSHALVIRRQRARRDRFAETAPSPFNVACRSMTSGGPAERQRHGSQTGARKREAMRRQRQFLLDDRIQPVQTDARPQRL